MILQRNNNGTGNSLLGQLFHLGCQIAVTIENKALKIAAGTYELKPFDSPHNGRCFLFQNTAPREYIEMHVANWAHELKGCVAPGAHYGKLDGLDAVISSGPTLEMLLDKFPDGFTLTIKDPV